MKEFISLPAVPRLLALGSHAVFVPTSHGPVPFLRLPVLEEIRIRSQATYGILHCVEGNPEELLAHVGHVDALLGEFFVERGLEGRPNRLPMLKARLALGTWLPNRFRPRGFSLYFFAFRHTRKMVIAQRILCTCIVLIAC